MYPLDYSLYLFAQIDDVISQAQTTRAALGSQRALFGDVQGKVKLLSDKFPVIRGILGTWITITETFLPCFHCDYLLSL